MIFKATWDSKEKLSISISLRTVPLRKILTLKLILLCGNAFTILKFQGTLIKFTKWETTLSSISNISKIFLTKILKLTILTGIHFESNQISKIEYWSTIHHSLQRNFRLKWTLLTMLKSICIISDTQTNSKMKL